MRKRNFQEVHNLGCADATIAALIFIGDHAGSAHLFKDVARGIVALDDLLSRAANRENTKLWTYLKFYGLGPHLFRLVNSGKGEWWIIADTLEEAIDLSVKAGMARSPHAVRFVSVETHHYLQQPDGESLRALLNQGIVGLVDYESADMIAFLAGIAEQSQTSSTRSGWVLTRDLSSLRES